MLVPYLDDNCQETFEQFRIRSRIKELGRSLETLIIPIYTMFHPEPKNELTVNMLATLRLSAKLLRNRIRLDRAALKRTNNMSSCCVRSKECTPDMYLRRRILAASRDTDLRSQGQRRDSPSSGKRITIHPGDPQVSLLHN